jgi:catechol 2,3-dioxygenase-like lactoylglutathione lyase family enzyme
MFKFQKLDHVVIITSDLERCLDFYINVLGCELERTLEELPLYQLRAGEALIDITTGKPTSSGRNMDHFCLQVANFNAAEIQAYFKEKSIPCGEAERRYGATGFGQSIYIKDPDGNTIELKEI